MTAITYGAARAPAAKASARDQVTKSRKSVFVRFMDALVESRLQHAHREILKHAHFLQDRRGTL
jgi:hypothetical protein